MIFFREESLFIRAQLILFNIERKFILIIEKRLNENQSLVSLKVPWVMCAGVFISIVYTPGVK